MICEPFEAQLNHSDQGQVQGMKSELYRRRLDYITIPTKGLVFASGTTSDGLARRASSEGLTLVLATDAPINQKLIEYESWLENAISVLGAYPRTLNCRQSYTQGNLIKEIEQAIEEVHLSKRAEWARQQTTICTRVPPPQFVTDDQCDIVDGGWFLFSSDRRGAKISLRKISP
jgi:hypothetical protein